MRVDIRALWPRSRSTLLHSADEYDLNRTHCDLCGLTRVREKMLQVTLAPPLSDMVETQLLKTNAQYGDRIIYHRRRIVVNIADL